MKISDYTSKSFKNAAGTFIYISAIAWFFSYAQQIFGNKENAFVIPIFMLLLFVISACITGFLVLGKPILWYMEGLKKEAFNLFFATVGWLGFFLILVGMVLALV